MDSGATSHCSLYHEDFAKFTPVKPHAISGVHGASISAIGIGKIKHVLERVGDLHCMIPCLLHRLHCALYQ